MEFKSGFDATPYMDRSSWGKPKYKKVTDPDTSQKVYTGNGSDIHPNKKDRYKLQGEKDPDIKTIAQGSTRAAVAIKRRKGSDYIPVIEARAKVIPDDRHIPGQMRVPDEYSDGVASAWSEKRKDLMDRGILADYLAGLAARERIAKEWNEGVIAEYREAQGIRLRTHTTEKDFDGKERQRTARECIATDTPEYAYKVFRLLTSDIVGHAKREGLTPAQFYKQFNAELYRLANNAASQTGVEREQFAAYIREHAPKVADAIAGKSEKPDTTPEPDSLKALQKKLSAATRRRDKAQREIDELDLQITAMLSQKTVEEVRHDFYQDMQAIDQEVEAKPERSEATPMRKSKKQQKREARREKRRAKRGGRKTSERMAA